MRRWKKKEALPARQWLERRFYSIRAPKSPTGHNHQPRLPPSLFHQYPICMKCRSRLASVVGPGNLFIAQAVTAVHEGYLGAFIHERGRVRCCQVPRGGGIEYSTWMHHDNVQASTPLCLRCYGRLLGLSAQQRQ